MNRGPVWRNAASPLARSKRGVASYALAIATLLSVTSCEKVQTPHAGQSGIQVGSAGGGFNGAPSSPDGDWTSQARDYANSRYSALDQINVGNANRLKTTWTFSDGALYGHEGAPLVTGNTMYIVSPFPNRAFALDLTKPGGPIKWVYDPKPSPMAIGKACCDAVLRGWAIADSKLIYNLLDAHVWRWT